MLLGRITAVYSENYMKPINTFYGQNAELLTVTADGTINTAVF
jgi:hypothetical protein